jgi:hypothetical protein
MRAVLVAAMVAVVGCEHWTDAPVQRRTFTDYYQEQMHVGGVGATHEPYRGKPRYLAEARPLHPVKPPVASDNPCAQRSTSCEDRLRALLAAVDGHLLALTEPPKQEELKALDLTLGELPALLVPYTDVTSEGDELLESLAKLPTASVVDREALKQRMKDLVDLIRVQLVAAR